MLADFSLIRAFGITLQPLVLGLVVSAVLGIAIGVAMGLTDKAEWFASPIFIIAQAAPLAALIPLIVFAYGIGLTAKTLVVCIMAMPVIVLNSFAAVRHTPISLVEMGRSFLASPRQVILKVILPAASPVIFAGLQARLRRRLHRRDPRRAADHADRRRRPHHLQPLDRATIRRCMRRSSPSSSSRCSSSKLLERVEVTMFRPEKRARA